MSEEATRQKCLDRVCAIVKTDRYLYCVKCVKQKYESQLKRINKAPRVKSKAKCITIETRSDNLLKERRAFIKCSL